MTRATIDRFDGEYRFLSNFYPSPIRGQSLLYPTVEHAYQAAKAARAEDRQWIQLAPTPGQAKRRGRQVAIRSDWEELKLSVMRMCLVRKFHRQHDDLARRLLETGDAELIEGNTWGDRYWGVCNGVGENHLGRLLMKVREELRLEILT